MTLICYHLRFAKQVASCRLQDGFELTRKEFAISRAALEGRDPSLAQDCRRETMSKAAILDSIAEDNKKPKAPDMRAGDTVRAHVKVREAGKERIQLFEGTVIAVKNGGIAQTVTLRKISNGVGVERTFPLHSPNVAKFDVIRRGLVRRAKLYYLRDKVGKEARIKERR